MPKQAFYNTTQRQITGKDPLATFTSMARSPANKNRIHELMEGTLNCSRANSLQKSFKREQRTRVKSQYDETRVGFRFGNELLENTSEIETKMLIFN